jgi:hypothetical protein
MVVPPLRHPRTTVVVIQDYTIINEMAGCEYSFKLWDSVLLLVLILVDCVYLFTWVVHNRTVGIELREEIRVG